MMSAYPESPSPRDDNQTGRYGCFRPAAEKFAT